MAWRELPQHIGTVTQITAIASQFGCRQTAAFSLVGLYGLADNFKVDDRALAVTTGYLVNDSALMMQMDRGGTSSPYFPLCRLASCTPFRRCRSGTTSSRPQSSIGFTAASAVGMLTKPASASTKCLRIRIGRQRKCHTIYEVRHRPPALRKARPPVRQLNQPVAPGRTPNRPDRTRTTETA